MADTGITTEQLQEIIRQAITADRQSRSWTATLKKAIGGIYGVFRYLFDIRVVIGLILGALLSFAVAGGLPSLPHWNFGTQNNSNKIPVNKLTTLDGIVSAAFQLPTATAKFPLIETAATEAKKPSKPEERKQEWVMMTASLRNNELWKPIAEALDALIATNEYAPDYFDKVANIFASP